MGENLANFCRDALLGPFGMLALQKRGFVPPHRPVQPVRRLPPLVGRHAAEYRDLFGTGLLIRQHGGNVAIACHTASRIPAAWQIKNIQGGAGSKNAIL
jgi:hypothetical protein